jgi:hypothetical protein
VPNGSVRSVLTGRVLYAANAVMKGPESRTRNVASFSRAGGLTCGTQEGAQVSARPGDSANNDSWFT